MSLLFLITEASRKDIIINKIGFNEKIAEELVSEYGKKRSLLYANILRDWYKANLPKGYKDVMRREESMTGVWKSIFNGFDYLLSSSNKPSSLFKDLKKASFENDRTIVIGDSSFNIGELPDALASLRDYVESAEPVPDLKNVSLREAINNSIQWHEELEASGNKLQLKDEHDLVHKFEDGYYWVDLNSSNCSEEAEAMGHCGRTDADTLLSLRDSEGEPHVTVAFNRGGEYRQMKGKGNSKPIDKYHEYCEWLFTEEADDYQLTAYNPEYRQEEDFTVNDLDYDLAQDLLNEHPELDGGINIDKLHDIYTEQGEQEAVDYFNEKLDSNIVGFNGTIRDIILEVEPLDDFSDIYYNVSDMNIEDVDDDLHFIIQIAEKVQEGQSITSAMIQVFSNIKTKKSRKFYETDTSWVNIFTDYCEKLLENDPDKFKTLLRNLDSKHGGYVRDFIDKNNNIRPSMKLFVRDFVENESPKEIENIINKLIDYNEFNLSSSALDKNIISVLLLPMIEMCYMFSIDFTDLNDLKFKIMEYEEYDMENDYLKHRYSRNYLSEIIWERKNNLDQRDVGELVEEYNENLHKRYAHSLKTLYGEDAYESAINLYEFVQSDDKSLKKLTSNKMKTQKNLFGDYDQDFTDEYEKITEELEKAKYL